MGGGRGARPLLPRFKDQAAASAPEDGTAAPCARRRAAARLCADAGRPAALLVLLDCGVRRNELGGIRIRDFDLGRRQLMVFGKGQKERVIPLRGRIVMALKAHLGEPLEFVGRRPEPDDYLLYPEKRTLDRRVYWAEPKKPCAPNTLHRWWYRMLEQAGLVGHASARG